MTRLGPGRCLGIAAIVLVTRIGIAAPPIDAEPSPAGTPSASAEALPAAQRQVLWPRAPTPDWDVGVVAGVCGVGQSAVWQGTEFCGAILTDVLWLRTTRQKIGLGGFLSAGTAGFYDFRPSLGVRLHVPTGQLLSLGLRAGPLLHVMGDAALPGFVVGVELGIRTLNQSGHYALTHALVLGWDQSFGDGSRAGSALTIALRVDGFWFAVPIGMAL